MNKLYCPPSFFYDCMAVDRAIIVLSDIDSPTTVRFNLIFLREWTSSSAFDIEKLPNYVSSLLPFIIIIISYM